MFLTGFQQMKSINNIYRKERRILGRRGAEQREEMNTTVVCQGRMNKDLILIFF